MRQGDVVHFLHTDHLGSTSLTTDTTGAPIAQTRYRPYGEQRWTDGDTPTDFTFTGQRADSYMELIEMGARWYDPQLGRFISPDPIIPGVGNPQVLNHYAYPMNNPLRFNDPSGNFCWGQPGCAIVGAIIIVAEGVDPLPLEVGSIPLGASMIASDPALHNFIAIYGPQLPAYTDTIYQFAQQVDAGNQGGQNAGQGGNTGNADPNDPFKGFRNAGEKYQHQTSGTRFGQEVRLNVQVRGQNRTIDVDNILNNYLHESKYLDPNSSFYSRRIGRLGTGLDVHVRGWEDEFERLSLAAQQHGYSGVKVFINNNAAIQKAQELFRDKDWFKMIELVPEHLR